MKVRCKHFHSLLFLCFVWIVPLGDIIYCQVELYKKTSGHFVCTLAGEQSKKTICINVHPHPPMDYRLEIHAIHLGQCHHQLHQHHHHHRRYQEKQIDLNIEENTWLSKSKQHHMLMWEHYHHRLRSLM
jgi:hypothetical protein